jgi:hypothetical protein
MIIYLETKDNVPKKAKSLFEVTVDNVARGNAIWQS